MVIFAIGIKDPFASRVQRQHHSDPREHRRPVLIDDDQQGLGSGLPWRSVLLRFRQRLDVFAGILQA